MRLIPEPDARQHFDELLDAVEHGETIVVTREGRAIARIVPPPKPEAVDVMVESFRKTTPSLTVEEILSARDEGRKS